MLGMHSLADPDPTRSSRHGSVALSLGTGRCRLGTPRGTEGHLPQSSAPAGTAQVRRDASRLPPLCGDTSRLPLQRGCIVAASALAGIHHGYLRTPTYCIICSPLFFKQSGDASRVPPRMGGCIVDASAVSGTAFLTKSPALAQTLSTGTASPRAQCQPHTVEVEVATRCTQHRSERLRPEALSRPQRTSRNRVVA